MSQHTQSDVLQPNNTSRAAAEPLETLRQMITGFITTCLIYVAAQLRIADHLAAGSLSATELAARTETRVEPLRRVLRGLTAFGLLSEGTADVFELTTMGTYLRSDHPQEQRTWALLWGHEMFPRSWGNLLHVLKTGEIPFDHVFGMPFFNYLVEHEDVGHIFDAALGAFNRRHHEAVLATYDFGPFKRIVDVGGGAGDLVAAICARYPAIEGAVFDLPSTRQAAEQTFRGVGVDSRCRFVVGNFFESVPPAGDLVMLSRILHDWDDERAVVILRQCERAIEPGGRLLVLDQLMIPGSRRATNTVIADLQMLATLSGRERTESEFGALLAAAGLRLQAATPTSSGLGILEAVRQ
jgi:SAM-dependent methyltransferase